ncbi:MAG: FimV/HubP family polar landmark protein [Pseudomonadota bacterium]
MHRWLAALVVAAFLSLGNSALALGLGEITTRSALNEPMRAQISLLGATQEELSGLEIRLASPETFERYGIDKPAFLNGLRFKIRAGAQPYVEVTSTQPIGEPFITMLVEAVWPRGRLLREYTILLDPPTFQAPAAASAPSASPAARQTQPANRGTIRRDAPASTTPAPRPASLSGDSYRVQRNDTLWEIAQRIQPDQSVSINQVMLAIYQSNPDAFGGNINRLNAGAVLNLPSSDELVSINRSSALQEVRRQNQSWRGGEGGSLTLVAPDDDAGTGAPVAARPSGSSTSSDSGANRAELAQLQRELQEKENQLRVQNEELARLQAALAARGDDSAAMPEDSGAEAVVDDGPVSTEGLYGDDAPAEAEEPSTGAEGVFAETDEPAANDDVAEPVAETPAAVEPPPARTSTPVVTTTKQPSLVEKIIGSIWTYVGAGVLAIIGLLALLARRRSAESDQTGTWESLDATELEDLDGTLAATGRLRELDSSDKTRASEAPAFEDPFESTSPVDEISKQAAEAEAVESGVLEQPAADATGEYSIEDTFSSDTAINFDQSDPLAEADFHMAYGLYDQAADLVKGALAVDGSDNRLKAKLCEIYFVWGNQEGFVDAAAELKASLPEGDPEWNKVVIMGQQIAPANDLFSGVIAGSAEGDVDISLDADTMLAEQLDEGDATGGFTDVFGNDGGTIEQPADLSEISGIDFEFDEEAIGGDDAGADSPASEDLSDSSGLDFEFDGTALGTDGTVEQPVDLDLDVEAGEDLTAKLDDEPGGTAEMDLADLDLDTGSIDALPDAPEEEDLLAATGATSVLPDDFKVDMPIDDNDATVLASSEAFDLNGFDDDAEAGTTEMPQLEAADDDTSDATGIMPMGGIGEVDMDVADLTTELAVDDLGDADDATMQQPVVDDSSTMFSEQVFGGDNSVDSTADTGLNLALDDTGETNIAEVGTKLDLARAYVDMGDPDGARSILQEVLTEGDDNQRAEAQQLLDNLG